MKNFTGPVTFVKAATIIWFYVENYAIIFEY